MLKVVILAAGKSTRMKSDTPKVLHDIAGVPMLHWVVEAARTLTPAEIIVIVGHGAETVRKEFAADKLTFVTQDPQLGTGHAVMQARAALADATQVAVLCGDVPLLTAETLARLSECHRDAHAAATVLTTVLDKPAGYGRIVRDELGNVKAIIEQRDLMPGQEIIREINSGTYLFNGPELLARLDKLTDTNAQKEYYLTDVVHLLERDGKPVAAWCCEDWREVLGINTRKELAACDKVARARVVERLMAEGVTILDPENAYIEAGVKIGRDTVVYPYTAIHAGVHIGERCEIGPYAHLRQGTVVGNDCKVGAFVETKNARIGDESKAGHLAYLGDVTLGKDVNIGAGTIVANYDGQKKHKTEIGDEAFIGCGTVLVAPVKVGKRGQTGANTVVPKNKDVPDDTIVVGAPARVLKKKA